MTTTVFVMKPRKDRKKHNSLCAIATTQLRMRAGDNHSISSTLFAWNVTSLRFVERQRLPTVGAYDWTHFRLDGYHLLVVANSFSGPPRRTTRVDSVIYFWQSGSFLPFQTLQVGPDAARSAGEEIPRSIGHECWRVEAPRGGRETERSEAGMVVYRLQILPPVLFWGMFCDTVFLLILSYNIT